MKLLFYGINYLPELTGIGKYTGEMCEFLAEKGHDVEVITTMPYYPQWKIQQPYRGRIWHLEMRNGVKVYRCPFYVPKKVSGITRIIHELSFMLSSLIFWLRAFWVRYDAVIAVYPPLPIGLFPILYKWIRRRPVIFHIQDLQVDAARRLGIIRQQKLLDMLEHVERFWMRKATVVSTISEGMRANIIAKGIPNSKIGMYANWVDTERIHPLPDSSREGLKQQFGFASTDQVVLYAGNMGEKQGLDAILKVAHRFQLDGREHVKFLLVGQGGIKDRLMAQAREMGLRHVRFHDLVPLEKLNELLNMPDLHLVLQKKGVTDLVMPSKLTGILAAGGCCIVAAEAAGTLSDNIKRYQMGFTTEPENVEALYQAIVDAANSNIEPIKAAARQYALEHLEKNRSLSRFEKLLMELSLSGTAKALQPESVVTS